MANLVDKYVIHTIIVFALVVAGLCLVLGTKDGIAASGKATDIAGTSVGAVIGFIPRFFTNVKEGISMTKPDGTV